MSRTGWRCDADWRCSRMYASTLGAAFQALVFTLHTGAPRYVKTRVWPMSLPRTFASTASCSSPYFHAADAAGRQRIHVGAMRRRAAQRAGLPEVPVATRKAPADPCRTPS